MSKPLCIFHANCDDGFGAAWVVRRALGENVEFYPGVYQKPPPDVAGRDVIMVDFSYKRPILEDMMKSANSLLILDHHHTAAEDLADVQKRGTTWAHHLTNVYQDHCEGVPAAAMYAEFDMTRSGAGIAWDFFCAPAPRPAFIDYLEDRDLWRQPSSFPYRDEFTIALRSHPQDFTLWDHLVEAGPKALIAEGKGILRYYRLRCEEMKRSAYETDLGGHRIWISNAPYFAASEVAGELAERGLSFGACYFEVEKGRFQYSLRSRGDFDVSDIAKRFGGGGHKGAAGFTTDGMVHE